MEESGLAEALNVPRARKPSRVDSAKVKGNKLAQCCLHRRLSPAAVLHALPADPGRKHCGRAHFTFSFFPDIFLYLFFLFGRNEPC